MYEVMYNKIIQENADIVCCKKQIVRKRNEERKLKETLKVASFNSYDAIKILLESYMYSTDIRKIEYSVWNKLYRKDIFYNVEFPIGKIYDDQIVTLKLLKNAKKILLIDQVFYNYYQHSDSVTKKQTYQRYPDLTKSLLTQRKFIIKNYPKLYYIWKSREIFGTIYFFRGLCNIPYSKIMSKKYFRYNLYTLKRNMCFIVKNRYYSCHMKIIAVLILLIPNCLLPKLYNIYKPLKKLKGLIN